MSGILSRKLFQIGRTSGLRKGGQHATSSFHAQVELAEDDKPLPPPTADGESVKVTSKVTSIVDSIANLSLIEVSQLNAALKEKLNLPDLGAMPFGTPMGAVPAGGGGNTADDAEEEMGGAPVAQTAYKVKLVKYDQTKKIAIIKEIKNASTGLNLVQAKKFIESLPQVVMADIGKDEAEKLKATLEAAGGTCELH